MPKKLKDRPVLFFFSKNTKEENEAFKKELTELLREIIINHRKKGFLFLEIFLLTIIISLIMSLLQYFFTIL